MTMTATIAAAPRRHHTKQKVGLVLCALYGLSNSRPVLPVPHRRRGRPAHGHPGRRARSSA